MPVTTLHPMYISRSEDWLDCRNSHDGQRAIKDAAERYLPRLKGQSDAEYSAYKNRALFYSITAKTLSALQGMALNRPPELQYPDKMKSYFEDHSGSQFFEILSLAISEVLLMARFGALIDRPASGGAPYITLYRTENIVNWAHDDDGRVTMVVLREFYYERDDADRFALFERIRYRELYIDPLDGKVKIVVHTPVDQTQNAFNPGAAMVITNQGTDMTEIPFFCVGATGLDIFPHKPPMLDIVDINLSHYRTSADLEHGRHFTGLPTPYIIGADSESRMNIGSTSAWIIPDASAKVGFLEFTGLGLSSLEKALSEKQSQLASLSARLIDNSTRGSESPDAVKMRYLSETASLRGIIIAVEAFINKLYNTISEMEGYGPNTVTVSLNKEFLDNRMSPTELTAWVDAYLAGGVTKEMLMHALKRGDALPPPGMPTGTIKDPPPVPAAPKTSKPSTQN